MLIVTSDVQDLMKLQRIRMVFISHGMIANKNVTVCNIVHIPAEVYLAFRFY